MLENSYYIVFDAFTSLASLALPKTSASSPMTDLQSVKVEPIRVTGTARREGCGPNATVLRSASEACNNGVAQNTLRCFEPQQIPFTAKGGKGNR